MKHTLVLLGLPGLYGPESLRMGRLGLVGFLLAYLGTMLIAVSGHFGFLAPVLGRVWSDDHPSSQISSEAITTMAR